MFIATRIENYIIIIHSIFFYTFHYIFLYDTDKRLRRIHDSAIISNCYVIFVNAYFVQFAACPARGNLLTITKKIEEEERRQLYRASVLFRAFGSV